MKRFGVTIDSNLNFDSNIKEIYGKVNQKTSAFARLRDYIREEKTKLLVNTVVMSKFQYFPLIWLLCSRTVDNVINRMTKPAMGVVMTMTTRSLMHSYRKMEL